MDNQFDPMTGDFDTAFRSAQARAHAERAKVSREVFGALFSGVKGLFAGLTFGKSKNA
ncbi:MAG: hypothetical protein AAF566_12735 [Pseudomonadota bacterium]